MRPDQSFQPTTVHFMHAYEIRPRKDKRGFDLISDALPFGAISKNGDFSLVSRRSSR
jgi:hypothetical protein